jgi:hypothetical protein
MAMATYDLLVMTASNSAHHDSEVKNGKVAPPAPLGVFIWGHTRLKREVVDGTSIL